MPAPMFPQNATRFDPYRTFKFQVVLDGKAVAGLRKITGLKKTTEAVGWRTAGDPSHERRLPGGTSYEAITMEQGLTHDRVFEDWANLVNNLEGDKAVSLVRFRKDITINVFNLQGVIALSYAVKRAWVSEFQALPDLDAGSMNTVGIQTLKIEHEGFERTSPDDGPREI